MASSRRESFISKLGNKNRMVNKRSGFKASIMEKDASRTNKFSKEDTFGIYVRVAKFEDM